jgi:LysM repeat protein
LSTVAKEYNVEIANLAAYNQILDYNHVVLGQKLRIPPAGVTITKPAVETLPGADGYHVVREGDSMSAIARRYALTLEELMELNEIDEPNLVRMGTMLRVTGKVEMPSTVTAAELAVMTYTVQPGDSLSEIAQAYYTTVEQLRHDNKLSDMKISKGQELLIYPPATSLEAFGVDAPMDGERKIIIDLSEQTLTAYQGDVRVLHSLVSTGKDATPTLAGEFAIFQKLKTQHMSGEDYDLPGVPWVMYYYDEFAIHGAYWHANFGIPTSHGCTNMTIPESKALFAWAPLGTPVIVQQ